MARSDPTLRRFARDLAAVTIGGIAVALSQPGFGVWPLALVAFVPLFVATDGRSLASRFLLGWGTGTVAVTLGCVAQAAAAAQAAAGMSGPAAWLAASGVGQFSGAIGFGLLAVLALPDGSRPWRSALRAAAAMTLVEAARCYGPLALPWFLHASALASVPEWLQLARFVGALGVSGALAAGSSFGASAISSPRRPALWLAFVLLVLALRVPGFVAPHDPHADPLVVALVHSTTPGHARPAPGDARAAVEALTAAERLSEEVDWVLWPENAVPVLLPANRDLLPTSGAIRILGAPMVSSSPPPGLRASVFLQRGDEVEAVHEKNRLVPYFERSWAGRHGMATILEPGPPATPVSISGRQVAFALCYELLFEQDLRRQVREGATLVVHLSNEAWFAGTTARDQLLASAVLRAIELGRPVLRSTNHGWTAAIDARGRRIALRDTPGSLRVEIAPTRGSTPWQRLGPVPLVLVAAAALVACAFGARVETVARQP